MCTFVILFILLFLKYVWKFPVCQASNVIDLQIWPESHRAGIIMSNEASEKSKFRLHVPCYYYWNQKLISVHKF